MNATQTKERKMDTKKEKIEMVKTVVSRERLGQMVDNELSNRDQYENSISESYLETAERVRETHPNLADFMEAAEVRWFELSD